MILATESVGTIHRGLDLFLPTWPDILWSAVVLGIIAFVFYRFIMPKFMAVLDKRTEMIDGGIKQAEQVRLAAQETLAERHKMLEEAQIEAAKMRDAARAEGAAIVKEQKEQAQREVARIEATAQRNLEAQRQAAEASLRADVGTLATQLAAKIIGASLANEATKADTIDRFIDDLENAELGSASSRSGNAHSANSHTARKSGARRPHNAIFHRQNKDGDSDLVDLPEFDDYADDDQGLLVPDYVPTGDVDAPDYDTTDEAETNAGPLVTTVTRDRRHFLRK